MYLKMSKQPTDFNLITKINKLVKEIKAVDREINKTKKAKARKALDKGLKQMEKLLK